MPCCVDYAQWKASAADLPNAGNEVSGEKLLVVHHGADAIVAGHILCREETLHASCLMHTGRKSRDDNWAQLRSADETTAQDIMKAR